MDILESDLTFDVRKAYCALGVGFFRVFMQNLLRTFQTGECFRQLRSNGDDLRHGNDEETEEQRIRHESADGHRLWRGEVGPRTHPHDDGADNSYEHGRRK